MYILGALSKKKDFDRTNPTLPFSYKKLFAHAQLAAKVNLFSHPQFDHLKILGGNAYLHLEKTKKTDGAFWEIKKIIESDPLPSESSVPKDGCLSWTAIAIYLAAVVLVIIGMFVYIAINSP